MKASATAERLADRRYMIRRRRVDMTGRSILFLLAFYQRWNSYKHERFMCELKQIQTGCIDYGTQKAIMFVAANSKRRNNL
jgi:hypothetical protein